MGNLTLNGATSGQLTLAPPAVAGTNTLTLPAQTATVLTDSSGVLNIGSGQVYKDASGNVGIGYVPTTTIEKLNINCASLGGIGFNTNSSYTNWQTAKIGAIDFGASFRGGLAFSTNPGPNATTTTVERMRIDDAGNLLVGTTSANGRLAVDSAGATSATYAVYVRNSTPSDLLYIRSDGFFSTGGATSSPYNATTATAANVVVASNGQLQRSTSSLRYKENVTDATHGLADVMKLRSVTYNGKNDGDKVFGGFIAEEVDEAGLSEFVAYDEEGRPDALHYGNMVALMAKAIQEQQATINALTARIAALEAK